MILFFDLRLTIASCYLLFEALVVVCKQSQKHKKQQIKPKKRCYFKHIIQFCKHVLSLIAINKHCTVSKKLSINQGRQFLKRI